MMSWLTGSAAIRSTRRSVRSSRSAGSGASDSESPFGGLRAGDAITGQQKAFGALVAEAVRPHPAAGTPHTRVGG